MKRPPTSSEVPAPDGVITIALTGHQRRVLSTETLSAVQSAERDEDVAFWSALHAGLSASRWRVPDAHVGAAAMYCRGMVDVTEDVGVRRAFAAVLRKLTAVVAPPRAPLPLAPGAPAAATPGNEDR